METVKLLSINLQVQHSLFCIQLHQLANLSADCDEHAFRRIRLEESLIEQIVMITGREELSLRSIISALITTTTTTAATATAATNTLANSNLTFFSLNHVLHRLFKECRANNTMKKLLKVCLMNAFSSSSSSLSSSMFHEWNSAALYRGGCVGRRRVDP